MISATGPVKFRDIVAAGKVLEKQIAASTESDALSACREQFEKVGEALFEEFLAQREVQRLLDEMNDGKHMRDWKREKSAAEKLQDIASLHILNWIDTYKAMVASPSQTSALSKLKMFFQI